MTLHHTPLFDFDVLVDPLMEEDALEGYRALMERAPPLFWTPRNGGHWVALASEDVLHVMQHPELFSSRHMTVPIDPDGAVMIPLSLDPPEHKRYRQFLRPWFESSAIARREPDVERWAGHHIDRVASLGHCEFVEALASRFPVSVFMEMFGLPLDRIDEFRDLIADFFHAAGGEARQQHSGRIIGIVTELIQARTGTPRDDFLSEMIAADFGGRPLDTAELVSISFLMFLAGLETVSHAIYQNS